LPFHVEQEVPSIPFRVRRKREINVAAALNAAEQRVGVAGVDQGNRGQIK
jgi:phage host-nuclease inhibitor protein Gam